MHLKANMRIVFEEDEQQQVLRCVRTVVVSLRMGRISPSKKNEKRRNVKARERVVDKKEKRRNTLLLPTYLKHDQTVVCKSIPELLADSPALNALTVCECVAMDVMMNATTARAFGKFQPRIALLVSWLRGMLARCHRKGSIERQARAKVEGRGGLAIQRALHPKAYR